MSTMVINRFKDETNILKKNWGKKKYQLSDL